MCDLSLLNRIEHDPIDDPDKEYDISNDIQKIVTASHLSSPVHCVKLVKTDKQQQTEQFTVDLIATCYDDKLVCFKNIVNDFMKKPSIICDLETVSCVNSVCVVTIMLFG